MKKQTLITELIIRNARKLEVVTDLTQKECETIVNVIVSEFESINEPETSESRAIIKRFSDGM